MNESIRVTATEDGAVISVEGYDIIITVKATEEVPERTIYEAVQSRLKEYLEELDIIEEEEGIVVMPKGFLGRDRFSSIATIVEELGGKYISADKKSRFFIPKER